ncbi:MAG: glyceraldehyde 3-phosphate dehydrogenase NAD-binding domain-containing protein, partial [Pseudomonadota bacterium]
MKIFINGFGRIGRTVLRQVLQQDANAIEIVGINDIADADTCAYLLRYDSVFGAYPHPVEATEHGLKIGNISIPLWRVQSICELDLSGVDVVLECTGKAKDRQVTEAGLKAGARSVLVSGPSDAVEKTIVLGANEAQLGDERIVSNASCTTNAIAPLLCALDQQLGVDRAHVTTVHCYTGS